MEERIDTRSTNTKPRPLLSKHCKFDANYVIVPKNTHSNLLVPFKYALLSILANGTAATKAQIDRNANFPITGVIQTLQLQPFNCLASSGTSPLAHTTHAKPNVIQFICTRATATTSHHNKNGTARHRYDDGQSTICIPSAMQAANVLACGGGIHPLSAASLAMSYI